MNAFCYSIDMQSNKIAAFDIDRTLSKEFLVVPIIRAEEEAGLLPPGTFERVMGVLSALKNGELEYEDAAHRVLVAHAIGLQGRKVAKLYEHAQSYLHQHLELFRRFNNPVIDLLRPTHELIAVTAEPAYMAQVVVELLGMHRALSSEYEAKEGQFTGKLTRSLAHHREKRHIIGELRPDLAFGDSAGDIEMLAHAHQAFCISPDQTLEVKAKEQGWPIFDGDSDVEKIVSSIQGYLGRAA